MLRSRIRPVKSDSLGRLVEFLDRGPANVSWHGPNLTSVPFLHWSHLKRLIGWIQMRWRNLGLTNILYTVFCTVASAQTSAPSNAYSAWTNGPSSDPNYFPIAVWLQQPSNAARYKAAGFNTYVGL